MSCSSSRRLNRNPDFLCLSKESVLKSVVGRDVPVYIKNKSTQAVTSEAATGLMMHTGCSSHAYLVYAGNIPIRSAKLLWAKDRSCFNTFSSVNLYVLLRNVQLQVNKLYKNIKVDCLFVC